MIKGDVMGMQLVDEQLNERCLVNIVCGRCLNKKVEINGKVSSITIIITTTITIKITIHFSNLKLVLLVGIIS